MTGSAAHINLIHKPGEPGSAGGPQAVIRTLSYFDIFHYPLTAEEIRKFLGQPAEQSQLRKWLHQLTEEQLIFLHHGCYSLQDNPLLVHRRKEGNCKAAPLMEKARRIGRFLFRFPFVRAVGISGSLSKQYADEQSDIDFFIITRPDRLWIARTLMHLYKKLTYLAGRQHYYCMNYYLDEKALLLEDQNIFTATEIRTLVPASGGKTLSAFFEANQWSAAFLPACPFPNPPVKEPAAGWLKKSVEWLLDGRAGNSIDNFLYRVTQNRWKKKPGRQ